MLSNASSHNETCKTTYDCLHIYACRLTNNYSYMYNVHDSNRTIHLLKNPGKNADHQDNFIYSSNHLTISLSTDIYNCPNFTVLDTI